MPHVQKPKSALIQKLQGLHLFHFEAAACGQRVRFALAEKGLHRGKDVPWRSDAPETLIAEPGTWISRKLSMVKNDNLTEAYSEIHPNMVVPALVHDGRLYIESMDIVSYVDQTWPDNPLLPSDPVAAQLANSLVERGKELHISVRYVSFQWFGRAGRISKKKESTLCKLEPENSPEQLASFYSRFNDDRIQADTYRHHLEALENGYAMIEQLLSDGRPFLTGQTLSTADIIWSIKVLRIEDCGYPFRRNFPALFEWYSRITQRCAFQEGVMLHYKSMSRVFKLKVSLDNLLGKGLGRRTLQVAADEKRAGSLGSALKIGGR